MSRSRSIRVASGVGWTLAALALAGCPPPPARTDHASARPIDTARRAVPVPSAIAAPSLAPDPRPDADVAAELPTFVVHSTAMAGPFPSVSTYCANAAARPSGYPCLAAPNRWDDGARRGARSPFLAARRLALHDPSKDLMLCRVAVQTSRGWYVSHHDTPCYGLPAFCEVTTTEGLDFRWVDEIGLGVLLVRAANGDVCNGPTFSASFRFCGMGPDNVPRCTTPMTDSCSVQAFFTIARGQVVQQ